MLDGSGLQVAAVAEALSFSDPAYFSGFFKRLTDISPRAHRAGAISEKSRTQKQAMRPGPESRISPLKRRHLQPEC